MHDLIACLITIQRLKQTPRRGWERAGVVGPESVAEHSFGVGVIAALLARHGDEDVGRCVELALIHDLAESLVGDITPHDGISRDEKYAAEAEAIAELAARAGDPGLVAGWREYTDGVTAEARLVRDANQIEMVLQALVYERDDAAPADTLDAFWRSATERVETDIGRRLLAALRDAR
ncbi:MAG: HD domain-containing protein [Phycisphaerales bacterium]|nr:HD domain-containing protein [Phycisphaerae bacterium]NNF42615.1 HD domain-containing protein [Phycisphaerales bacterium]NNM24651.1 HD domain-containing protein [Phycisphaerales bacterium]